MSENEYNGQKPLETSTGVDIIDVLYLCLAKWYWFVISLILCLGIGTLVILRTKPIYSRNMQVLIKEESKNRSASIDQQLSRLGMGNAASVNNEMLNFQSPALTVDVVKRLKLDVNYSVEGMFHDKTLYGKTLPVEVQFISLNEEEAAALSVSYDESGNVVLSNFVSSKASEGANSKEVKGRLRQVLNTPVGRVMVTPAANFAEMAGTKIDVFRSTLADAVATYNRVDVSLANKEAEVINLGFTDVSKERAEDVLSNLVDAYNETWLADKNQIAVNTSKFINERLRTLQGELGAVDKNISSYQSSNLIPDAEGVSQIYMQKTEQNNDKMMELNNQLYMARYLHKLVAKSKKDNELLPANSGINAAAIENIIGEYNSNVLQRNRLVLNSSSDNPLLADLDERIAKQKQAIVTSLNNLILTVETQIKNLQSQENLLTNKIEKAPEQASYLTSIGREQKVKESLYIFLLQKREENELSIAFTAYNTRVITPPMGSPKPISPVKRNIWLVAFVLGLAIPFAVFYLREFFDTRVRGRKDMEGLTIPYIGEIPHLDSSLDNWTTKLLVRLGLKKLPKRVDKVEVVVKPQSSNLINEAFRVLRTNFEFCAPNKEGGVVAMIVSANPSSGKTFITMNLAMSMAIKNKKAVVVDLDLRKASSSLFVNRPKMGVSNYLNGQCDLSEVIVKYRDTDLDVIPVGTMPPNPAELLHDPRLKELFLQLRAQYDYIFVDCPPVEIVADSSIISQHVDHTIFVMRAHLLERSMLPEIEDFYRTNRYPNMITLLNGTRDAYKSYGYHRYGYRYGYRYDYGINYGRHDERS